MLDKFELEDDEHILCFKVMRLRFENEKDDTKQFLVVGTGTLQGEDSPCKGRVYVFEIYQMYEMQQQTYQKKLRLLGKFVFAISHSQSDLIKRKTKTKAKTDQKGPICSMAELDGYILVAIGSKVQQF